MRDSEHLFGRTRCNAAARDVQMNAPSLILIKLTYLHIQFWVCGDEHIFRTVVICSPTKTGYLELVLSIHRFVCDLTGPARLVVDGVFSSAVSDAYQSSHGIMTILLYRTM